MSTIKKLLYSICTPNNAKIRTQKLAGWKGEQLLLNCRFQRAKSYLSLNIYTIKYDDKF